MTSFKVGDRVQLNELGRSRNKRMRVQTGTVVKISAPAISSAIDVLFDGNKKPTRIIAHTSNTRRLKINDQPNSRSHDAL